MMISETSAGCSDGSGSIPSDRTPGKLLRLCLMAVTIAAFAVTSTGIARAQTYPTTVPYKGGPTMSNPKIYPVFIGNYWSTPTGFFPQLNIIIYLIDFVGFINGTGAPANSVPYLTQYGITSSSLQTQITVPWQDGAVSDSDIFAILWSLESSGQLPRFDPNALFVVFPGVGEWPGTGAHLGYHKYFSVPFLASGYYAVVFPGAPVSQSLGSSHEIQEALTDPGVSYGSFGWAFDAAHEICDDATCGHAEGNYVSFFANGIPIIGCADNTLGGVCTSTGYIP
jgi:hypothetical protein